MLVKTNRYMKMHGETIKIIIGLIGPYMQEWINSETVWDVVPLTWDYAQPEQLS